MEGEDRGSARRATAASRRIVVGVEGPESAAALDWAIEESYRRDAVVEAVMVWIDPYASKNWTAPMSASATPRSMPAHRSAQLTALVDDAARRYPSARVEAFLRDGRPGPALVRARGGSGAPRHRGTHRDRARVGVGPLGGPPGHLPCPLPGRDGTSPPARSRVADGRRAGPALLSGRAVAPPAPSLRADRSDRGRSPPPPVGRRGDGRHPAVIAEHETRASRGVRWRTGDRARLRGRGRAGSRRGEVRGCPGSRGRRAGRGARCGGGRRARRGDRGPRRSGRRGCGVRRRGRWCAR